MKIQRGGCFYLSGIALGAAGGFGLMLVSFRIGLLPQEAETPLLRFFWAVVAFLIFALPLGIVGSFLEKISK